LRTLHFVQGKLREKSRHDNCVMLSEAKHLVIYLHFALGR